jgi:hypothetical protein
MDADKKGWTTRRRKIGRKKKSSTEGKGHITSSQFFYVLHISQFQTTEGKITIPQFNKSFLLLFFLLKKMRNTG